MPKHPTIEIPNVGPMDFAWDVLGEWDLEFDIPFHDEPLVGHLTVHSWMEADMALEAWGATLAGLPERVSLDRASRVHLTDAGGGALQWVFISNKDQWTVQATMWPGALHLFVHDNDDPDDQLFRATAHRPREYYIRKYPLVTS